MTDLHRTPEHLAHFPYRARVSCDNLTAAIAWCLDHTPDPNIGHDFAQWRWDYYDVECEAVFVFAFNQQEDHVKFTLVWS